MKAEVVYTNLIDGSEQIKVGKHELQCGGQGDGYCYSHQSFDCFDKLTRRERKALHSA